MSDKIRALIADDEPPARLRLRSLLRDAPDIEIVGECSDGRETIAAVEAMDPDLLFLDVQMPEADGFAVVAGITRERLPAIVFVTAYDEFALRAFEVHALDYLLKPFDLARLQSALQRVRQHVEHRRAGELDPRLLALLKSLRTEEPPYAQRLAVKAGARIHVLNTAEVDYIEAESNYARVHSGERSFLMRETLSGLEARLDPERFLRIHRSVIVQTDRIRELEPLFQGEYQVILRNGARLRSGRSYRARLQQLLNLS